MKYFISFSLILLSISLFSQNTDTVQYINKEVVIDQEAHYPAGEMALYRYIYQNLEYPEEAKKVTLNGQITISYEVLPDSTVTNVTVLKKVGHGVDEEVVKLLKTQKFAPCIKEGEKTKMNLMLNIPIQRRADGS